MLISPGSVFDLFSSAVPEFPVKIYLPGGIPVYCNNDYHADAIIEKLWQRRT